MTEKRIIKRYTNRKLYDKLESRYVTLEEIARLVRVGEDVKVIDNESEEDLTSVTFAQIILDEEKRKTNLLSVPFLRKLIRTGEARVQDFSDRATRSIEALGDLTEKAGERVREVVGSGGRAIEGSLSLLDELFGIPQKRLAKLRETAFDSMDKIRANPTVRRELERLASSLQTLEEAVTRAAAEEDEPTDPHASAATSVESGNGSAEPADAGVTSSGTGSTADAGGDGQGQSDEAKEADREPHS